MMLTISKLLYIVKVIAKKAKSFLKPSRNVSYIQNLNFKSDDVKTLGSIYGAKSFLEQHLSEEPIIMSLGVGEDVSFDIEFISKYAGSVYLYDPTPRSEKHVGKLIERLGENQSRAYSVNGNQPVTAYNLKKVNENQIYYVKKAAWIKEERLKFYSPDNERSVSHSIIPGLKSGSKYIEVESVDVVEEMLKLEQLKNKKIDILKMDIEGAEVEVLQHLLDSKIYPKQLIVEYDKLASAQRQWIDEVEKVHERLLGTGYEVIAKDGYADFSYVHNE